MAERRLFWKLFPSFLLVTVISLLLAVVLASGAVRRSHLSQVSNDLEAKALLVAGQVSGGFLDPAQRRRMERYCRKTGRLIHTRITVILKNGIVVCDSVRPPATMDNHGDRPEVRTALSGRTGHSIRFSHTLREDMMYVAVPFVDRGGVKAVVRTAMPIGTVYAALNDLRRRVLAGGIAAVALAALLTFLISRRITRPIEEMTRQIEEHSPGVPPQNISLTGKPSREFAVLTRAMNAMAGEMRKRMVTIERERGKLAAVLESMEEGILAMDRSGRVVMINRAARSLLDIGDKDTEGRFMEEVVRNPELQKMARRASNSDEPCEVEVRDMGDGRTTILAHSRPLTNATNGRRQGLLMILADVTRLRRIEQVRRDFVANVSHELKTPITAIKGFSETLLEGALDDRTTAERFCRIISSHAERMENIVADLLTLSGLEGRRPDRLDDFHPVKVATLFDAAILACRAAAQKRGVSIEVTFETPAVGNDDKKDESYRSADWMIFGNARLLEQALVNLLDNAIKYSDSGGTIVLRCRSAFTTTRTPQILLSVEDHGMGIPAEHLPRIFERFYRVDKARSRKLGGTGLGLAIAKHIVLLHAGRIDADSTPGQGSTFTIRLPMMTDSSDSHRIFIDS